MRDPLDSQAESLVSACGILATTTFVPVIDQFTFLKTCKPEDWDFFAAVVAVNVALNTLATEVAAERFKRLDSIVAAQLNKWDRQGLAAVRDCQQFVNRAVTKGNNEMQQAVQALGLWVLWNLLQRQPTDNELHAAPAIGMMLARPLQDWWHPKQR
jgi:hypothetical protein